MSSAGNPSASGAGSGNAGGSRDGSSGPCGACKFLRRKCVYGCVFAPYFDAEQGSKHFAAVHKVFGASNVSKLLLHIPIHKRLDAVVTICYEAQARIRDPVHGCVAQIFALQQQVANLQSELRRLQSYLATLELPLPAPTPLPPPPFASSTSSVVLHSASHMPTAYDLSSLFEHAPPFAVLQPDQVEQQSAESNGGSSMPSGNHDDLQTLAHKFIIQRQGKEASGVGESYDASDTQPPSSKQG